MWAYRTRPGGTLKIEGELRAFPVKRATVGAGLQAGEHTRLNLATRRV